MECPICFENKKLHSKFKCSHKICNKCFEIMFLESEELTCCICRSHLNKRSLNNDQEKLYTKKLSESKQRKIIEGLVEVDLQMATEFVDILSDYLNRN